MLEAAAWGLLAGSSLVLGAQIGVFGKPKALPVGLALAFGAGTLISAISFELTEEAYRALLLSALLDGVPETAVLGTTLLSGSGVGVPVLAAIFMSNLPEGIGGGVGLQQAGVRRGRLVALWAAVAIACATAAGLGFVALDGASGEAIA